MWLRISKNLRKFKKYKVAELNSNKNRHVLFYNSIRLQELRFICYVKGVAVPIQVQSGSNMCMH